MGLGGWPDQARPYSSKQGLEPVRSTRGQQDSVEVRSPQLLEGGGPGHWEGYCRSPGSTMEACRRLRVRMGRWANHLEGRSRGLWDRLEVGPEEKAINVRGDSNLLRERLKGVGAPGTEGEEGTLYAQPPFPSQPTGQRKESCLASLTTKQPYWDETKNILPHCHDTRTSGQEAEQKTHRNRNRAPSCGQPSHSLSRPTISKPEAALTSRAPSPATGVSIPRTPTPKPTPESLPELIKPLIN